MIVPCYNEARIIQKLLRRVRAALPESQIIVVDDGSTDGSDRLIEDVTVELLNLSFPPVELTLFM